MPDGFEPHTELARIYSLKELMTGCQQRIPDVLRVIDDALNDEDIFVRMQAANMVMDRGFGKPRMHMELSNTNSLDVKRVRIVLPDNNRPNLIDGKVIDTEPELVSECNDC